MSDGRTYEMLWDCQFCGTKQNLGLTHRFCPNCGSPQNPDSRYYPSDEDKIEVKDHEFVGVDVICPSCRELNSGNSEYCGQCGAPLTAGARARTLEKESRAQGESFAAMASRDVVKEQFDAEMRRVGVLPDEQASTGFPKWAIGLIVGIIVLIGGAIFAFTRTEQTSVVVTGHEWSRVISIQEYQNFTEQSWRDSRPAGDNVSMRVGSCRQQQRSSRQVPDGQTCRTVRQDQGDGTFRTSEECQTNYREEPVYDDMCTWTGQRWTFDRDVTAQGNLSNTPAWPNVNLNCEGSSRVGCERVSNRTETYEVIYAATEDDNVYRCPFAQADWQAIPVESVWGVEIRSFARGSILCETLQRQ